MVKQWVQPPINKNELPPGGFLLGSHLTSLYVIYIDIIIKVFIRILEESFEIQFLAIFYIDFWNGFNQIWNRAFLYFKGFHWKFRGKFRNQVFGYVLYRYFKRDLIKFEIEFFSILRVFIGMLGESFEIQFWAMLGMVSIAPIKN